MRTRLLIALLIVLSPRGPDRATIEDLASKNGTFIDDMKIDGPAALADGQSFVLGDVSVEFRRSPAAGSTVSIARARKSKIHSGERR